MPGMGIKQEFTDKIKCITMLPTSSDENGNITMEAPSAQLAKIHNILLSVEITRITPELSEIPKLCCLIILMAYHIPVHVVTVMYH